MSSPLTPEQRQRIEENRRKALEKLASTKYPTSGGFLPPVARSPLVNVSGSNTTSVQKNLDNTRKNLSQFAFRKSGASTFSKNTVASESKSSKNDVKTKTWNVTTDPLSGVCCLISRERFSLIIPFNQKLVDLLKTIPDRQYDGNTRYWNFPLEQYDRLREAVAPLSPNIVLGNLPKAILQTFLKNGKLVCKESYKDVSLSPIETSLVESLFPFQREGVQFGIFKRGRCIIADEMGLGKTIQAIAIADFYRDDWPLLIVCPSSMRYQWEEEIQRHLPSVPSYSIYVMNTKKDYVENGKIVITSYDLMGKQKEYLKSLRFGFIILDESHSLKNGKTQRTRAALELASHCRRCLLLSGTPALSRPAELFFQIKAVAPQLFKDMIEYGVRYCDGKQDRFGWNFNGSSNLQELRILLEEKVLIRRLKADVLHQLPSKLRQVIVLSSSSINADSKVMNSFAKKLSEGTTKGREKRSTLLSYYAETGKAKIKAICDHVDKLLEQNKKFLVFGHHKEVLNAVSQLLEDRHTFYIRIDGSVSSDERKAVCDQFQEEEKFRVAVLSIKAANTGITLTAAQLIVFAELYWNPGELTQAEDRAHRIGQKDSVLVQYLIAQDTADDFLWPLVQTKLDVLLKVGLSHENQLAVDTTDEQASSQDQPKITSFFQEMLDNDDSIDDTDLASLMDEIEGVPEKKRKIDT